MVDAVFKCGFVLIFKFGNKTKLFFKAGLVHEIENNVSFIEETFMK
jgi:hypothetical protein